MKVLTAFVLIIPLAACSSLIKNGSIVEAQQALDRTQYEEAIEYTRIAESFGSLSSENKAKNHYIRALAQEGLGRRSEALDNYRYIVNQHGNSAYAAPSQRRLDVLNPQ